MPLSSTADSTFDSGQGSTVYSDSQSSQQSVVMSTLVDAQGTGSPPVSASEGPVLLHSVPAVPALGTFQQPPVVSELPGQRRGGLLALCPSDWWCPFVVTLTGSPKAKLGSHRLRQGCWRSLSALVYLIWACPALSELVQHLSVLLSSSAHQKK